MSKPLGHSATPWTVWASDPRVILAASRESVADTRNHAKLHDASDEAVAMQTIYQHNDAAHIVLCVNSHDQLVAALGAFLEYYKNHPSGYVSVLAENIKQAKQALANATQPNEG